MAVKKGYFLGTHKITVNTKFVENQRQFETTKSKVNKSTLLYDYIIVIITKC